MIPTKKIGGRVHKICRICQEFKVLADFYKAYGGQCGRNARCKKCLKEGLALKRHKAKRHPVKNVCREIYRSALNKGSIKLDKCSVVNCRTGLKIHGHHFNYSKPLSVIPLCEYHHRELHANLWQFTVEERWNIDKYSSIEKKS